MVFNNSGFGESLQIDGITIQQTPIGIAVIPNNLPVNYSLTTNSQEDIVVSVNSTLSGDIYCNDFTINSGITLTTNGYNIYCTGNFTNNGTLNCGYSSAAQNFLNSYGGSGGYDGNLTSIDGYSTLAAGGTASSINGSTPAAPTITNSLIQNAYNNGMAYYIIGAGGGNANSPYVTYGSYGIYIQAVNIVAGIINAYGQGSISGGGGGGAIFLSYQTSYTQGTYNVSGGSGGYNSGSGGNGQVLVYNYATAPIIVSSINIPSTQTTIYSATITLSANFDIQYSAILQTTSTTLQPVTYYFYLNGALMQTITAYVGSTVFQNVKKLVAGTYTYYIQAVANNGATGSITLTSMLIQQIIGNGG